MRAVARESWALTLWTYLQVTELDEVARVHREGERIDLASLFSFAMADPKQLNDRRQSWAAAAQLTFTASVPDALARGRRMIETIRLRGVLIDG